MISRAARAAEQSDPERNTQFMRWRPDTTTGAECSGIRACHALDLAAIAMTGNRRRAELAWLRATRSIAQ